MKAIATLMCLLIALSSYAVPEKVFDKLSEVNKCWTEQTDIQALNYPEYTDRNDREWIRIHLELVEQTLRARSTNHLSEEQKANRLSALDHLNEYWHSGAFPINDKYAERTPIFIDDHDNFCAVGYLVKATGHEDVSRMIASKTNLAYVREMNYPELFTWADAYGFTEDELAWIQPGYGPYHRAQPVGKGTNGAVYELETDYWGNTLYVGGSFTMVDSTIPANNVAFIAETQNSYQWFSMGKGVNGSVYAIADFQGQIFVAGDFDSAGNVAANNVAYWTQQDTTWHSAGCLSGVVKNLLVYGSDLYAVGDFDVCAALAEVNFAKWDNSNKIWQQIPGLDGYINTIEVVSGVFYLGGRFAYQNDTVNAIKWTPTKGFEKFDNKIENEVTDFAIFNNDLFASAKQFDTVNNTDTLLYKLSINQWHGAGYVDLNQWGTKKYIPTYNSLYAENDLLYIGGHFDHLTINDPTYNFRTYRKGGFAHPGDYIVDGEINSVISFNGHIIAGGSFQKNDRNQPLNNICVRDRVFNSIKNSTQEINIDFTLYPNPTSGSITIENNFNATQLRLYDVQGRLISSYTIESHKATIALPDIAAGTYIAELSNAEGLSATERLVVE